jgi:hypothetical protein
MNYFASLGYYRPPYVDLADFLLNLSAADTTASSSSSSGDAENPSAAHQPPPARATGGELLLLLVAAWRRSGLYAELMDRCAGPAAQPAWMPEQRAAFPASRWFHFRLLLNRQIKLTIRYDQINRPQPYYD